MVLDATGLPLVGAAVTLRGAVGKDTQTNAEGQFDFQGLAEGNYELSASVHGFAPVRQTIQLMARQRSTVSLTLAVALLKQTVVTAEKTGAVDAQATPIAVSVLSGDTLARMQAHTVEQVAGYAPGIAFSQNTGLLSPRSAESAPTPY